MEEDFITWMQVAKRKQELNALLETNSKSEHFGLTLTREEAEELLICRDNSLKKYQRVEFGSGILESLIFAFCDSPYIDQNNFLETMKRLQDIFYEFKKESGERLTDEELIHFMKEQFDTVCYGSTQYLESTCLERFSRAVRAGYDSYEGSGGIEEYEQFDEEERWDSELYRETLAELAWR